MIKSQWLRSGQSLSGLGALVYQGMKTRQWTLADLSSQSGIPYTTLVGMRNNVNRVPELQTLSALSTALDIPLGTLIEACGYSLRGVSGIADQHLRIAAVVSSRPELMALLEDAAGSDDETVAVMRAVARMSNRK